MEMGMSTTKVMAEALGFDGSYYMSRGRRGTVLVSREYAWEDVKAWQRNPNVKSIRVRRGGDVVWTWER
jgi:hypothetical protein